MVRGPLQELLSKLTRAPVRAKNEFQEGYNVKDTMLCAGETQADSCQGDSGGNFLATLVPLHSTLVSGWVGRSD